MLCRRLREATRHDWCGRLIQALSTLVFTFGLIPFTIDRVREKVITVWSVPVLVLGGLATFFPTPPSWIPGLAWLVVGSALLLKEREPVRQ